jgi:hypothetical protein
MIPQAGRDNAIIKFMIAPDKLKLPEPTSKAKFTIAITMRATDAYSRCVVRVATYIAVGAQGVELWGRVKHFSKQICETKMPKMNMCMSLHNGITKKTYFMVIDGQYFEMKHCNGLCLGYWKCLRCYG